MSWIFRKGFADLCKALSRGGAFLVVQDENGRPNPMTIGWAQAGFMWGQPIMTVLVRPSRYTHASLENAAHFSVCVPARGELKKELAFCGSKSGRDYDKIRACGMTLKDGAVKGLKYLDGCALVYQCELAGKTELKRETLPAAALAAFYPGHEAPHTLYFGKIIKADKFK